MIADCPMLVTVVMPAYNAQEWISESLESVLKQTYDNLEIVVVDDGSTDRTVEVAETSLRRGGTPYRILRQPNKGAAGARNLGWRAARGPWVQFLDADDLLEPQKIALQVERAFTNTAADVVYSDWQRIVPNGRGWKADNFCAPIIQADALADILSARNFLQLGSLLFKTSILDVVGGFDQPHEPIEDVGLCLKIGMAGGVFVKAPSSGPMSSYRDLPRSFSKWNHRRFIESCMKNAKLAEQHVRRNPNGAARTIDAIVEAYFAGARYFAENDWTRFEEVVADIEALRPAFVPKAPMQLNILSRIAGYRRAERVAVLYRKAKKIGGMARIHRLLSVSC
jgi:glycosyltransferase involved in cell wall biosynthesis